MLGGGLGPPDTRPGLCMTGSAFFEAELDIHAICETGVLKMNAAGRARIS